ESWHCAVRLNVRLFVACGFVILIVVSGMLQATSASLARYRWYVSSRACLVHLPDVIETVGRQLANLQQSGSAWTRLCRLRFLFARYSVICFRHHPIVERCAGAGGLRYRLHQL